MAEEVAVRPAEPDERRWAVALLFRHAPSEERDGLVMRALAMLATGELDPMGLLVSVCRRRLVGSILVNKAPGNVGLVWPPQVLGSDPDAEDVLVAAVRQRLGSQGVPTAQALLRSDEAGLGEALKRNGFPLVTSLWFLRRALQLPSGAWAQPDRPRFVSLADGADPAQFESTLLRTYEGTLDCPELNGVRTGSDILAGHRAQGRFDPALWWLVLVDGEPAAVLLVNPSLEGNTWELAYMGVTPSRRRQGLGRQLLHKALCEGRIAEIREVTLSVDERNTPARSLYQTAGFEPYDVRDVYLAVFPPPQLTG